MHNIINPTPPGAQSPTGDTPLNPPDDDQTPTTFEIRGWSRPTWATGVEMTIDAFDSLITFTRDSSLAQPGCRATSPTSFGTLTLTRTDELKADGAGAVIISPGEVLIVACNIEDMSPAEARQLAGALIDLADLADRG